MIRQDSFSMTLQQARYLNLTRLLELPTSFVFYTWATLTSITAGGKLISMYDFLASQAARLAETIYQNTALLLLVTAILVCYVSLHGRNRRLPPGPPGDFFGNHIHLIPSEEPWKKFDEWHKRYGASFRFSNAPNALAYAIH